MLNSPDHLLFDLPSRLRLEVLWLFAGLCNLLPLSSLSFLFFALLTILATTSSTLSPAARAPPLSLTLSISLPDSSESSLLAGAGVHSKSTEYGQASLSMGSDPFQTALAMKNIALSNLKDYRVLSKYHAVGGSVPSPLPSRRYKKIT
jgi:hypothetical protein